MKTNRRDFLFGLAAIGCEPLWGKAKDAAVPPRVWRVKDAPEVGAPLAGWKPGEMDIHFIYTGCGENAFYILPDNMRTMCGRATYPGERLVFPTAIPDEARRVYSNCFWWPELPTKTGHVVVRVAPGGERYRVYVVDARDERGTVLSVAEGIC